MLKWYSECEVSHVKIEIWSDYVCPFCYIGKRSLEQAVDGFKHKENIVIEYKSYELDPNAEKSLGVPMKELFAKKYNISVDKAKQMNKKISDQAKELGLDYDFDLMQHTNSFDAHRLTKFAIKEGKGNELVERLLKAYFEEGKLISNHSTLIEVAQDVGLNGEKARTILDSCKYTLHVRDDQDQALQMGVEGVPFFVFNETYALSGVQSIEVFMEVLDKVWEEESLQSIQELHPKNAGTSFCTDEGCQIDKRRT